MGYSGLMRNAAKILFGLAATIFLGGVGYALLALVQGGLTGPYGPGAVLAGLVGGVTMAIPPFVGAAILWRLDIWLFEKGGQT